MSVLEQITADLEQAVAVDLLDVYRRLSGAEPNLRDERAAAEAARLLLRAGVSTERLELFWRSRLNDFLPAVVPDVAFLVQPQALAEAPGWEPAREAPRPSSVLLPAIFDVFHSHTAGSPWTRGAALLVQRTAEASAAGQDPFISPQLGRLVREVRRRVRKAAPL